MVIVIPDGLKLLTNVWRTFRGCEYVYAWLWGRAVIDVTYNPLPFWNDHMIWFRDIWLAKSDQTTSRKTFEFLRYFVSSCLLSEPALIFEELYAVFIRKRTLFGYSDDLCITGDRFGLSGIGTGPIMAYEDWTVEHRKMCCSYCVSNIRQGRPFKDVPYVLLSNRVTGVAIDWRNTEKGRNYKLLFQVVRLI